MPRAGSPRRGARANRLSGIGFQLGDANLLFERPKQLEFNEASAQPEVGDFNGDGNLDIAVASSSPATGAALIAFGLGHGNFTAPVKSVVVSLSSTGMPPSVLCCTQKADLNADGAMDLIAISSDPCTTGMISLLNDGNGKFTASRFTSANPNVLFTKTTSVAPIPTVGLSDLDQDGLPDLAIGNASSGRITLYKGVGDGIFSVVKDVESGLPQPVLSVRTADLNADGLDDISVSNR